MVPVPKGAKVQFSNSEDTMAMETEFTVICVVTHLLCVQLKKWHIVFSQILTKKWDIFDKLWFPIIFETLDSQSHQE